MADSVAPPAVDGASTHKKPDEAKYKEDLAKADKAHKAAQDKFKASKEKFDAARNGRSTPSSNDRFKTLVEDQKSIRAKQSENKSAKGTQQEKFNRNDAEVKKLIAEQKDARTRAGFKSADEIESRIASIRKQVDSGQMKVADEKKSLDQINALTRQKKTFANLDDLQKTIDAKKTENTELKKTFDNPESRALAQRYEDNQKELDDIKASREGVSKNLDSLRADKDRLHAEQEITYQAKRKVQNDYYAQRTAHKEHEDQIYQQRRERQRTERDAYEKEKRKRNAEAKLEEASGPAFMDEIRTAEGLIRHFDPSYNTAKEDSGPGEFAATTQRSVDESGFKGMKVVKKEEEDFFIGGGGKKKGKGKKGAATNGADTGKMNLNMGVIEELGKVGVDPPSTQADVPSVVEKLKQKVEAWKKDQKDQTEKNISKAQAEIHRLETEAANAPADAPPANRSRGPRQDRSKKVAQKDAGVNVDTTAEAEQEQEQDAVKDVEKEMKATKIEDKENADLVTA